MKTINDDQWRYTARAKAIAGHDCIVRLLQRGKMKAIAELPYMNPPTGKVPD